ncbi:hypothetical protein JCM11251_004738 [Rhodosporidiobolus azoricus]
MAENDSPTRRQEEILDAFWPLSRFVGYRPPPPEGAGGQDWGDYVLPKPWREKRRRRRHEQGLESTRTGSETEVDEGGADKHRDPPPPPLSKKVVNKLFNMLLTLIGSFFGAAFVSLSARSPFLSSRNAPLIVGSFGAEGVLLYAAHTAPLTQPKNVLFGNTISAILGVAVAKAFMQIDGFEVGDIYGKNWAAAATSLAVSLFVMQLFEVTHPPGGATALLAVTVPQVSQVGWWYVPQIMVGSLLMLTWALIINNVGGRRYPTRWSFEKKWIII